jgi:endonuclease/exonuclease/phosphatase family metal-dependent hydrolase
VRKAFYRLGFLVVLLIVLAEWLGLSGASSGSDPFDSPQACRRHLQSRADAGSPRTRGPRIGTWNIRWFPRGSMRGDDTDRRTDRGWLACTIAALDVDVLAVQEILQGPEGRRALLDLIDDLDRLTGGRWAAELDDCPGSGRQHLGLLYDRRRVQVQRPRAIASLNPGEGACDLNLRPGFGAYLRFEDGPDLHLVTVHLDSGVSPRDHENRRRSVQRLPALVARLREQSGDDDVLVLGDFNTMGRRPPSSNAARKAARNEGSAQPAHVRRVSSQQELEWLDGALQGAGLGRVRPPPGQPTCSEYYRGKAGLLDHVYASRGMAELSRRRAVEVAGACALLKCGRAPNGQRPASLSKLSDHCPLVVALLPADRDGSPAGAGAD